MDYHKIYRAFISNRKGFEGGIQGYAENHHILPRCLGGSDTPSNIIRLTAREHYFAHCLLAKMHGGKMWSALFAIAHMAKTDSATRYFSKRRMVEACRGKAAECRSRQMKAMWADGSFARRRVYEPWSDEAKAAHSLRLMGRKSSLSAIQNAKATRQVNAARFDFVKDGNQKFTGTSKEFCLHSGVSQAMISHLTRKKIWSASGWTLAGTCRLKIMGRNPSVFTFSHRGGDVFCGTMFQFRNKFDGIDTGSLSKMVAGRLGSIKGWALSVPTE